MVPDSHLDLLAAPLTATVTTIGADGFPQSSAIWFMWEDGRLWYSTKHWAAKYRNVEARPATSFLVLDPHDEFRYVEIRGTATRRPRSRLRRPRPHPGQARHRRRRPGSGCRRRGSS